MLLPKQAASDDIGVVDFWKIGLEKSVTVYWGFIHSFSERSYVKLDKDVIL